MNVEMIPLEQMKLLAREDIGYTQTDVRTIYEIACKLAKQHITQFHDRCIYLIGSYATGAFTPQRSDCDMVSFYDGDEISFIEYSEPVELCNGTIKRDMTFSICARPIRFLEDYWNQILEQIKKPFIWKILNAVEDYLMIHDHGKHMFGINMIDQVPVVSRDEYYRYLILRSQIIQGVTNPNHNRLGVIGISKAMISNSRDAFFLWSGKFRYETYRCLRWLNTLPDFPKEGKDILEEAVQSVDVLWEDIMNQGRYEVQLMKMIRKCKKYMRFLREYETAHYPLDYKGFRDVLDYFDFIAYNLPPTTSLKERLYIEFQNGQVEKVSIVEEEIG